MKTKLPAGWGEVEFLDCLEFEASNNKLKIQQKDFLEEGEYPIIDQGEKFIAGYTNDKSKIYSKKLPVVIFGDHTRIIKFVNFSFALGADGVKILVPNKHINAKYLYYVLNKLKIPSAGYSRHYKFLKEIKIPLPVKDDKPDLETQQKIVSILEKAEKAKEWRKKADELTNELLKAVFFEMFGKYFEGKKYLKKIEFFCPNKKNSIKAGPFGSSLKKESYVKKGYKIYGQEQVIKDDLNFGDYYIDRIKYLELENYKVQEGDILISLVGTYGKISIVPKNFEEGIINPRLMKITLDKAKMNPIFFKYLFLSPYVKSQLEQVSHGGTMDILNVGLIKNTDFPEIPISLQNKFASIVKKVEEVKEQQKQSKEQLDNLFNVLMQ